MDESIVHQNLSLITEEDRKAIGRKKIVAGFTLGCP